MGQHLYPLVRKQHRPVFAVDRCISPQVIDLVGARIILPPSEDDVQVSMLLVGQTFELASEYVRRQGLAKRGEIVERFAVLE